MLIQTIAKAVLYSGVGLLVGAVVGAIVYAAALAVIAVVLTSLLGSDQRAVEALSIFFSVFGIVIGAALGSVAGMLSGVLISVLEPLYHQPSGRDEFSRKDEALRIAQFDNSISKAKAARHHPLTCPSCHASFERSEAQLTKTRACCPKCYEWFTLPEHL